MPQNARLGESDFLLGVHDMFRSGGLRYKLTEDDAYLDNRDGSVAPPFVRLRELEAASRAIEEAPAGDDPATDAWLRLLLAPGASLGGARPKASVVDVEGHLWIAKFPSVKDRYDIGAWELVLQKLAQRRSSDEMKSIFKRLIRDGSIDLENPPCQNTISHWMNDPALTPILRMLLEITAQPFRKREVGAIIDSSQCSQMSTAHSRCVKYEGDFRPKADWMKCHVLVGVETMIVMAVEFSGTRGAGTHDINFIKPLIKQAIKTFPLQDFLADKAYYGAEYLDWLWSEFKIRAFIPVKKNVEVRTKGKQYTYDPCRDLIERFDEHYDVFQATYRYRSKIEGFFSVLKRVAGEHCWSHGRPHEGDNADQPCVAWMNETLCKLIFMNLRTTVSLQCETGYMIDYPIADRFFPPALEPLLAA